MKTYADGMNFKTAKTKFGAILKIGINAEKMIAFLNQNKNEKGFVNIDVMKRKQESEFGETHYAVLNEYKSDNQPKSDQDVPF